MPQATDKTNSKGNWKPTRYARIYAVDQELITRKTDGAGVFSTKYFSVWSKLNFSGYRASGKFFQESLFNIQTATGLDKKTIRQAIRFLKENDFIAVKDGERDSLGLKSPSLFKLLRNLSEQTGKSDNPGTSQREKTSDNFPLEPEGKKETPHDTEISPVFINNTKEGGLPKPSPPNSLGVVSKKPEATAKKPRYDFSGLSGKRGTPKPEIVAVSAKEEEEADDGR